MTCEEALLLISGHLDQMNTQEEEAQLQAHLQDCEACRNLLQAFREIDAGILALEEEPPADLCSSVMEAVRKEAPVKKKKRPVWITTAVAAALVFMIGAGAVTVPGLRNHRAETAEYYTMAREMPKEASLEMAREVPAVVSEEAVQDFAAADAYSATGPSQYSAQRADGDLTLQTACEVSGQEIADTRKAAVVVLDQTVPELTDCSCEVLDGGSRLYTLDGADTALQIWENHGGTLCEPAQADPAGTVSYALVQRSTTGAKTS